MLRNRFRAWTALFCLTALVTGAPAEERKAPTAAPTIIVRLKSFDGLIGDILYLAEAAGKGEEAKQGETVLKQFAGPKGLEGIDTKKPMGVYGKLGPNGIDSEIVVLVPIADEEAALAFLGRFAKPEKGDDGVYTVNLAGVPLPVYFRFVNRYAFVTVQDKDFINPTKLLKPAAVLAPALLGTLSATVNLDQIPKQMKQMLIGQVELKNAEAKETKRPGETEAEQAGRAAGIDLANHYFKQVLNEGGPINVRLDVNKKAGKLLFTSSLAGAPGTKLAGEIAALAEVKSAVSGLIGTDSAFNVLLQISVPAKIRKVLEPLVTEGFAKALKEEKDENKRKLIEPLVQAIVPTLKTGNLDVAASIRGPGPAGKYSFVAGVKVEDGAKIEQALKDIFNALPRKEQKGGKLDFAKAGDVNIHRVQPDKVDDKTKEWLGTGPMFLALRDDAALIGGGEGALEVMKDAIVAKGTTGTIAQLELAFGRFAKIMDKDTPGAVASAKKAFAKNPEADKFRLTLTGGKALSMRLSMDAPLLLFFQLLNEAKKKGDDQ